MELENALMSHPDVMEAAVIAKPDERWTERPLACVVAGRAPVPRRRSCAATSSRWSRSGGCRTSIAFIEAVPKTSVGKFDKKVLRAQLAEGALDTAPAETAQPAK